MLLVVCLISKKILYIFTALNKVQPALNFRIIRLARVRFEFDISDLNPILHNTKIKLNQVSQNFYLKTRSSVKNT
jgi:hypothetical protein